MFGRHMHYRRWGYWRPRWYWRRRFFPGCGCFLALPILLIGALALLFLAHIL